MAEFNSTKRFIKVGNKANFIATYPNWETEVAAAGSIIFFQDTLEIWALGDYYGASKELIETVEGLNYVSGFTAGDGSAISADGATVVPMNNGDGISITMDASGITFTCKVVGKEAIVVEKSEDNSLEVSLKIDTKNPGNVTLTQTEDGLKAEATIPEVEYPVVGVVADDKVLSLNSNKEITSNIGINYDSTTKKIQLLGKLAQDDEGEWSNTIISEFDASDFVKDAVLDDVTVVNIVNTNENTEEDPILAIVDASNPEVTYDDSELLANAVEGESYIRFVWNTDGESKVDYVKTSDLADLKTNNVEISAAIPVQGGPLATDAVKQMFPNGIPANMSMLDLLFKLFCEEKWSSVSKNAGNPSTSVATTLTLSKSGVQEVGTAVTISALSAKQTNTTASASVSGFDYTYYSLDGKNKVSGTSVSKSWEYTGEGTESAEFTGSVGFGLNGAVPEMDSSLVVEVGTNTISASSTGVAKTATCEKVGPVYDVSNLGNIATKSENIYTIEAQSKSIAAPTSSKSASVTGIYPVYSNSNGATQANLATATTKKLADASVFEITFGPEDGATNCMFSYPTSHAYPSTNADYPNSIKVEIWNPNASSWGVYPGGFETTTNSSFAVNSNATFSYNTWTRKGAGASMEQKFRFTLYKSTSTK